MESEKIMNDQEKWEDLALELFEASEVIQNEQFDDRKPSTMVCATLAVLSQLVFDYQNGNQEMAYLFAELMVSFFDELKYEKEKLDKFDRLLIDVDLD